MTSEPNPANRNDSGIETRLNFVRGLLKNEFDTAAVEIKAIAYEYDFPWPYNNFVYVVTVDDTSRLSRSQARRNQPGTQEVPNEKNQFIFRLPNPESGYNDKIRVENEVACLEIARAALDRKFQRTLAPHVYGWGSSKDGEQGWILQEYMPGQLLVEDFPKMTADQQQKILGQMADILGCFQQYELPSSVEQYGGLRFDDGGRIISGPMSIMNAGPFATYKDLVGGTIRSKLADSESKPELNGWRDSGIQGRVLDFLANGLETFMSKSVNDRRQVLVHGDFSTDNCLYDPTTMELTAILDFDFAHIGTVADEFFRSLGHGIGRFPDLREGQETFPLQKAMLEGFPEPLPEPTNEIQWPVAKAWDDALRVRNLYRPSTISRIEDLSQLFWLSSQLLPFMLSQDFIVKQSSKEQLARRKAEAETVLSDFLTELRY